MSNDALMHVDEALTIARALGDKTRFEILSRLAARREPLACLELRESLKINAATLSHHMKELEAAGLIESAHAGRCVNYVLRRDALERFAAGLREAFVGAGQPPR